MSVYFARVKGYVKVGYSKDPQTRVYYLTANSHLIRPSDIEWGDEVDLWGWLPGDRKLEREVHMALGAHHVVGEWFWDEPEVEDYLRSNPFAFNAHDPDGVIWLMEEHPNQTRERVLEVWKEHRPPMHPGLASIGLTFADGDRINRAFAERREADRQYWREHRHELAGAA